MKNFLKKGDGLATIIITIVLIVIVLLIVPVLKSFQANAGANTKTTAAAQTAMINDATADADKVGAWELSDGTPLKEADANGGNGGSGNTPT